MGVGVTRGVQGALVLLLVVLAVGCSGYSQPISSSGATGAKGITGSGKLVTQEQRYGDFSGVEARSAFAVDIFQSDTFQISVTADDNVIDDVEIGVTGGSLMLAMSPGSYLNATYRARIGMPTLHSLDLSEATTVTISGFKSADDLDIRLLGASRLTGRLEAGQVRLAPGEASVVTIGGKAESLTMEASGASESNLGDWAVGSASVSLREASRATVNVSGKLDADLRAASTLHYVGNPTLGTVTSSEASTLRRR